MKTSLSLSVAALASTTLALPEPWGAGSKGKHWSKNKHDVVPFTSKYSIIATPDQVVNATQDGEFVFTGGPPLRNHHTILSNYMLTVYQGAIGYYDFGINSDHNLICYNIHLYGFRGEYESAADTASASPPPSSLSSTPPA